MPDLEDFQVFLDDISICFIEEHFAGWENRILLPFSMVTSAGTVAFEDNGSLRRNFEHYLTACRVLRIDAIIRRPIELVECEDGTLMGTYETELLSHGLRVTDPYTSNALLCYCDGVLKMNSILNAKGHHSWTGVYPTAENVVENGLGLPNKSTASYKSAS